MTTIKGITQSIYCFYRQLGVTGITVTLTNDFCYWDCNGHQFIEYSLRKAEKEVLLGYQDYFKKHHPDFAQYPCNFFTFSLLHELGHALTIPDANKTYINRSMKAKRNLFQKNISLRKKQLRYCELYVERIANEKAIELIKNNYEIIQKFEKRFAKLIA